MFDVAVIGAGAAGYMAAITAKRENPKLRVAIIEKTSKTLAKVRISGGGRCNVTHQCYSIAELSKAYPRGGSFLKQGFSQWNVQSTLDFFKDLGVEIYAQDDGRMFPTTNDAQTIIDCLLKEADKYKVQVETQTSVEKITVNDAGVFLLQTASKIIEANFVCVAAGGFPKAHQFDFITSLGHTIESPVPSLFTFNIEDNRLMDIPGISVVKATVKVLNSKLEEQGPLLITHWGLSGPGILKLSAWGALELFEKNYQFENSIPLIHHPC